MAVYKFKHWTPVIDKSSFVHPLASVTGDVIIGPEVYVGPGAHIRGDWGQIVIEKGCNVQENCVIHMFPGTTVFLREMAHIGHGAVIHGANIGRNCLIGMNAVVMDRAEVGEGSIIGALSFVPADTQIAPRSLAVGNPIKVIKEVSDEMLNWKTEGTKLYMKLPQELREFLVETEPLQFPEADRVSHNENYLTWNQSK